MPRLLLLLPLLLLTASGPSPYPDMGGVGHELHGLTETQTALFLMVVLLVVSAVERTVTNWRVASALKKLGDVLASGDAQAMANMAVINLHLANAERDRRKIAEALAKVVK